VPVARSWRTMRRFGRMRSVAGLSNAARSGADRTMMLR
jgi:hypothetical protein